MIPLFLLASSESGDCDLFREFVSCRVGVRRVGSGMAVHVMSEDGSGSEMYCDDYDKCKIDTPLHALRSK